MSQIEKKTLENWKLQNIVTLFILGSVFLNTDLNN